MIGYFDILEIHEKSPENLWDEFHVHAGIEGDDIFEHFSNKDVGYAIGIGDVHTLEEPLDLQRSTPGSRAPQDSMYAPEDLHLSH